MLKLSPKIGLLVLSAAICTFTSRVEAAISGPFVTSTPVSLTLTDWSSTLAFPKFNSGLGTLLSVTIDLDGAIETVVSVTNNSLEPSSGTAKTEVQLSVQTPGGNLSPPQLDLLSPNFAYSLGPGDSATSGLLTKTGSWFDTYTAPAILAEFNGPGTILLSASTFTQTLLANTGGNTGASQTTRASLTGQVMYTYATTVPEPASVAVWGLLGVVGLTIGWWAPPSRPGIMNWFACPAEKVAVVLEIAPIFERDR